MKIEYRIKPTRAPLYGGLLIVAAMVAATLVTAASPSTTMRAVVYMVALIAFIVGAMLTLHDLH
jgi:UDP-N-acetylmuramyl pentapeptide phosphotransferase/UDP-N-acetylglucosamine-1-phosphate transferase